MNILHLASSSLSRKMLLEQARIPYMCISQIADETVCDWSLALPDVVMSIALHKMEHVVLAPAITGDGERRYVVTADTLCGTPIGGTPIGTDHNLAWSIQGKPRDREDARDKIRAARYGARLCTAFCLDLKEWRNNQWIVIERIAQVVSAAYVFDVPDEWIERYLDNSCGLRASNAIAVEEYGMQFLKSVSGSYSAIIGLPLYELRMALDSLQFFK